MQSLETQCAVRAWPGVRTERGQDPIAAGVELLQQDQVIQAKKRRTLSMRSRAVWGEALVVRIGV